MGKCSECAHEDVPFYKDPCYWCLRLNDSGLPIFDKFEPRSDGDQTKEEKENEEMGNNDERYCRNCQYEDLDVCKEPCNSCIGVVLGSEAPFHPNFVKKENKEKKEPEQARSCEDCLHEDVFFFREPCKSCLSASLITSPSHPNFVKKENAEMKNAEEEMKKPKSYCANCKHIDVGATEEPCISCWGFNKFEPKEDKVNHPSHYTTGEIEVINYIRDKLGCQEFTGYCIGNVMKYISRWRHKDGTQDLEKAKVYLQWAIESAHKEESEV